MQTIKKIASGAIGLLMTGATLMGAAAADLSTFDTDFTTSNSLIVVGTQGTDAAGLASDVASAINIGAKLGTQGTSTAVSTGGTTVSVGGCAATEEILLGFYMGDSAKGGFDQELDDGDLSCLQDSSITFQSTSYDMQDQIYFNGTTSESKGPVLRTSLNSSDDDYESNVYMEIERGAVGYYYLFDKAINISKTTTSNALKIDFLGTTLKIVSVTDKDTFTAYVGEEVFLNVGDSTVVEGKTVTLQNVASGSSPQSVIVDVDGVTETVSGSTTETVNGIQITVDETFYSDTLAERSATLVVGETSSKTYNDGDAYIGEDETDPDWVWDVDGLNKLAVGDKLDSNTDGADIAGGPTLGIYNKFVKDDDSDNPITVGGSYDLPGDVFKISFDSLTVADDNYATYTIEYDASSNLDDVYSDQTSEPAIYIHTTAPEGLTLKTGSLIAGSSSVVTDATKTDKIWLSLNDSNASVIDVFYEDTNNNVALAGGIYQSADGDVSDLNFGEVNYGKTKSTNIGLDISYVGGSMTNITLDVMDDNSYLADGADDLIIRFSNSSTEFNMLGDTLNTEESDELLYGASPITIGTKDEDHRTLYGVIIKDPKSNGASDEVDLRVPADIVKANVIVEGSGATVTTGGTTTTWAAPDLPSTGISKTDADVTSADKSGKNLILVGGPVVNSLVQELATAGKTPTVTEWRTDLVDTAIVQQVDDAFTTGKMALVVAGYAKANTKEASLAIMAGGLTGTALQIASDGTQSAYTYPAA